MANLTGGGSLHIVDFYDQRDLPPWFGAILKSWLKKFHVQFWNGLLPHLTALEKKGAGKLQITPVARRYAFIAEYRKAV